MHYGTRYGHAVNALCSEACAVQDCWVISGQFLVQQPWYQAGSVFRACFFPFLRGCEAADDSDVHRAPRVVGTPSINSFFSF